MKSLGAMIALAAFATTQCVVAFKSLTNSQRNLAYQIMATWENEEYDSASKSWKLRYDYCENIDDGQGITIGFTGFTTSGGDALNMIKSYRHIKSSNAFAKISSLKECLDKVANSDSVKCFKCEENNCRQSTLCDAAKHAYSNDEKNYILAQQVQDEADNWENSQRLARKYNIVLPLAQAFLYDSCVNHACDYDGNDVEGIIIKHAIHGKRKIRDSDSAQKDFFKALLESRKEYMCSSGCDCCEDSKWRIPGWEWLGEQGYWNMPSPMKIKTLQDGGDAREYTFQCNPNQHPGCGSRRRRLRITHTSNSTSL